MTPYNPQLLDKYAEVVIKIGVNLREGQRLLLTLPLGLAPFAHLLTKHAYLAGARFVDVVYFDREIDKIRLENAAPDSLAETAGWRYQLSLDYHEAGNALLRIVGTDPDIMAGQDPESLATVNKAEAQMARPVLALISAGTSNWSIAAGATTAWAQKVFPEMSKADALSRLWDVIFDVCRVRSADPVAAWQAHISGLRARQFYLDQRAYTKLRFQAPGTDLTMGLPDGHRWQSGSFLAKNGIAAVPNMPTEEVFTLPHREQIDGFVYSTKPLSYAGSVIEDFSLIFENGRVVKAMAAKGASALDNLLDTDEGARSLGEIALVPHSSPVSQSNLLFYDTLFDENASSHLALGSAYRYSMEGADAMSPEVFREAGGNYSLVHVDFMVGSEGMDVDGLLGDGTSEPVMRGGEWAFDV